MLLKRISGTHNATARAEVQCDFRVSSKCKGIYFTGWRSFEQTRGRNDKKDICLFCSRTVKFSGRFNPNCRYPELDDSLFQHIDSEGKAYMLGWFASDGSIPSSGVSLAVHTRDREIVAIWNKICGTTISGRLNKAGRLVFWQLSSTQISNDVCRHLNITTGKKSHKFRAPVSLCDSFLWAFVRGWFDGDGSVNDPLRWGKKQGFPGPIAKISSENVQMCRWIAEFSGIPCSIYSGGVEWAGNNALEFLAKLYDGAHFALTRKRELYDSWRSWVPGLSGRGTTASNSYFKCVKTRLDAVLPGKTRASDSGYDLTAVELASSTGNVEFYDTGIRVLPSYGLWFALAARSSLAKKGYILANCFGVIDRSYTGTVKIPLIKIDPSNPARIECPERIAQLVPMPAIHLGAPIETIDVPDTHRGDGGFGSTGK